MEFATIALFAVAALALTATPGPDMILIASRSAAQGRLAGLATWAGIAAGTYVHALAAALGLSQLFLAVPVAYDVVRFLGAAYLVFLAWQTVRSPKDEMSIYPHPSRSVGVMFRQGLLTNILNPKMVIFVLALFPQFIVPDAGSVVVQVLILATVLNGIGFFVNGAVILAADRARLFLSGSARVKTVAEYILGTVFIGLAARLAFDGDR